MINMEAFISYFWENEGFQYDPTKQYLFGWYHISMMILMVLIFIGLWFLGKKKFFIDKGRMLSLISILLLSLEVIRIINFIYANDYIWFNAISFHLCSFGVYLMIIAGLLKKKVLFDIGSVPAVIGGLVAIIIPHGVLPWWNSFSFNPIQSYLSHMLMIFIVIYAIRINVWKPKLKNFWISIISIFSIVVIIHIINMYKFNNNLRPNNYFWTRYPDPLFPVINDWVFPYHIIFIMGLLMLFGLIFYLIYDKLINTKKSDN